MYGQFAEVYDRLMGDFDYPGWATYYLSLIGRAGVKPASVCDCACGTGLMSLELMRRGLRVIGIDKSETMLREAQAKARAAGVSVPFICQDMRTLSLPRPVDAMVCVCDGVNHLLTEGDLRCFFQAAFAHLKPGGALVFDVSSAEKLRAQAKARFFGEDLSDLTYLWQNDWDERERLVRMDLCFFLRRGDGLYARVDERQTQKAHETEDLLAVLKAAGFEKARVFGDRTFEPPCAKDKRVHFLAVRPRELKELKRCDTDQATD